MSGRNRRNPHQMGLLPQPHIWRTLFELGLRSQSPSNGSLTSTLVGLWGYKTTPYLVAIPIKWVSYLNGFLQGGGSSAVYCRNPHQMGLLPQPKTSYFVAGMTLKSQSPSNGSLTSTSLPETYMCIGRSRNPHLSGSSVSTKNWKDSFYAIKESQSPSQRVFCLNIDSHVDEKALQKSQSPSNGSSKISNHFQCHIQITISRMMSFQILPIFHQPDIMHSIPQIRRQQWQRVKR